MEPAEKKNEDFMKCLMKTQKVNEKERDKGR